MTNELKIDRIRAWQNAGYVHPLTCGVSSLHENLDPVEKDGNVILRCPTCGYEQTWIPEVCLLPLPPPPFSGMT